MKKIIRPSFDYEKILWEKGYTHVIGVDEVGRGCFAGPVVTAAVIFPQSMLDSLFFLLDSDIVIDDSKRLTTQQREKACEWIKQHCLSYAIGEVDVPMINKIGIGKASLMAMRQAVARIMYQVVSIKITKPFLLIDAFYVPHMKGIPKKQQKPIIKGDQLSISIAAASIVAKVYRDHLMTHLSPSYPAYKFAKNKGYGTLQHRNAIKTHGLSQVHRTSFHLEKFVIPKT